MTSRAWGAKGPADRRRRAVPSSRVEVSSAMRLAAQIEARARPSLQSPNKGSIRTAMFSETATETTQPARDTLACVHLGGALHRIPSPSLGELS